MSLTLALHTPPEVPLEAEALSPQSLAGLGPGKVESLAVLHGNRKAAIGDFFTVTGSADEELRLEGDLARVKLVGGGMSAGRLIVAGDVGLHLGTAMTGGEILVEGDAGDWVGPEMAGGRIVIKGNAGHGVGSAYRGSRVGMTGGEIIVHGQAGNEVGNAQRNGLIAIGGHCGDFAGVNLLAGTIVVLGRLGIRAGAGMKRGTIVAMREVALLPTFTYACRYRPPFLPLYLRHLARLGLSVTAAQIAGAYKRWSGDSVEFNRGEILVLDG
jgi:formylmethanofuran dehydrogenase subunit C